MTVRKFGRTALVSVLVLTILLSITSGTIAWFTDEVNSGVNKITAGNLLALPVLSFYKNIRLYFTNKLFRCVILK